ERQRGPDERVDPFGLAGRRARPEPPFRRAGQRLDRGLRPVLGAEGDRAPDPRGDQVERGGHDREGHPRTVAKTPGDTRSPRRSGRTISCTITSAGERRTAPASNEAANSDPIVRLLIPRWSGAAHGSRPGWATAQARR